MMRKCLGCDAVSLDKWFAVFLNKLGAADLATQQHILGNLFCSNTAVRALDLAINTVFIQCPILYPTSSLQ